MAWPPFGRKQGVSCRCLEVGQPASVRGTYKGPWANPDDVQKINGMMRYSQGTATDGFAVTGMAYSNKWNSTDQVPERAITSGQIGLYGEEDPTDGGNTSRFSLSARAAQTDADGSWKANLYFIQDAVITDNPQGIISVGNHPQGVPAYMANLWSTYRFSIADMPGFIVGAGLNYRDKNYSDITNVNSIPAFVIGNALFGYEADTWGISLNVKNFTNQRYYMQANAAGATVGESLSAFLKVYIKQ